MTTLRGIIKTSLSLLLLTTTITPSHGLETCPDDTLSLPTTTTTAESHLRGYFDPRTTQTKGGMCDGYNGILKINPGDPWAASGTVFFIYVISQIIYAEQRRLIPWIHFDWEDSAIYDPEVHNAPPSRDGDDDKPVCFKALVGTTVAMLLGEGEGGCWYPGPPDYETSNVTQKSLHLDKSGLWEHYFEPVSAFRPKSMTAVDVESCALKPLIDLDMGQLWPGVHSCAPWALRSWAYHKLPRNNGPDWDSKTDSKPYYNWMGRMRAVGHRVVSQYIHPKPWLVAAVDRVNPINNDDKPCLAMHVRHTDKAGARRRIGLDEFLPWAQTFVANGGERIYLATDTLDNIGRVEWEWPKEIAGRVSYNKEGFYSKGKKPVFEQMGHHRSNTEALTDIYAIARCGFLLHGYSGLTEASIYINPELHRYSVNLEDEAHPTEEEFAEMVRERLNR